MTAARAREEDENVGCKASPCQAPRTETILGTNTASGRESILESRADTRHPGTSEVHKPIHQPHSLKLRTLSNLPINTTAPAKLDTLPHPAHNKPPPPPPAHNKTLPTPPPPPHPLTAVTSISINIPSSINPACTIVAAGLASPNASRSSANTGSAKSLRSGRM